MVHRIRIDIIFQAELESVLVGVVFLLLRILGLRQRVRQLGQLRFGQSGGDAAADRTGRILGRRTQVSVFQRIFRIGAGHVTDFVTDDRHQFAVGHRIHQRAIHPHAAVAAGKRIDVLGQVDLEIQLQAVDGDVLGQPLQPPVVIRRIDLILLIHLLNRALTHLGDVRIGQRNGADQIAARLEQLAHLELRRSPRTEERQQQYKNKIPFHNIVVFILRKCRTLYRKNGRSVS